MAERPGEISKLFNSADARMKHNLEQAGIPENTGDAKMNDKASKSIIMVQTE
jgi:hypothetical protein